MNPNLIETATPPIPEAVDWVSAYEGGLGPLLNMSQAVPGDPPPNEFLQQIAMAAGTAEATRYGEIFGDDALRSAYAAECSRLFGAPIAGEEVAITAGCNQAFFLTVMALAAAGDAILLPAPWYFNHKMTLDMLNIKARVLPLAADTGFVPSVADASALIDDTVKAIVLVTPNNPTGATYPPELIASFFELAHARGIHLILDETYRDFRPEGGPPPHGTFADPRWRDTVISLYSFSKSFAIPGHRLGALIAGTPLLNEIGKILDCLQICPARVGQMALPWALAHLKDWRANANLEIASRAEAFRQAVAPFSAWRIDQIGAYFAYVRHPFPDVPATVVAERLAKECGLLVLPGTYFGPGQSQHLRFAFANADRQTIAKVPERLAAFPESASGTRF